MILIISDRDDGSTSDVIKWIKYFKKDFIRVNENSIVSIEKMIIDDSHEVVLKVDGSLVFLSKITSVWYRRGRIFFSEELSLETKNNKELLFSAFNEMNVVRDFIYSLTKFKKSINNAHNGSINKLYALFMAIESGLTIPSSLITSNKKELSEFQLANNEIITKPIHESPIINSLPTFNIYTENVTPEDIEKLPENYFMSLFQKKINKKYELRIFYLHGEFYSMAIFSQSDDQTSVDFRKYKGNKPNRKTPYRLPKEIEEKIKLFMSKVDLNCGSIDMVVTNEKDYVFLEVNPVGQFNMVSYPCNYNIEKDIACYLQ
ncbi:grasp-with-spasm system ATP-grasp peptide maturase [uncultured Algibacter sp.]|uniref:grasp-with-spasm system ATP-grasp peptide maturase n=1 Tax=uncultured Algibacter sp. TaxID=298659 RepID=UPI003217CE1C